MREYETIAAEVLQSAFGDRFLRGDTRIFSFGPDAGTGTVDGIIDGLIAVEVGVGSGKQTRASVLEVAMHPHPGKPLMLVDTPGHTTERSVVQTARSCRGWVVRVSCSGLIQSGIGR